MYFISVDGQIHKDDQFSLRHDNRGFRYGDGLFETMKMIDGRIPLKDLHFERLFTSLTLLKYHATAENSHGETRKFSTVTGFLSSERLEKEIAELAKKNACEKLARIRLTVFRGHGGLYEGNKTLNYIIECHPLQPEVNHLNEKGLTITLFPDARKSCDRFSSVKSANFLPYSMAALWATEQKSDDCLVLNTNGNICDATIANIFIICDGIISTPSLKEGCVNGVMRKWLLKKFGETGRKCIEATLTQEDILSADEVFLTNAVTGIRWVKKFDDKQYNNELTIEIYNDFVKTIWAM